MSGKTAAFAFCGVCALLAILLLAGVMGPMVSGLTFAVALAVLGTLSRGFRKGPDR